MARFRFLRNLSFRNNPQTFWEVKVCQLLDHHLLAVSRKELVASLAVRCCSCGDLGRATFQVLSISLSSECMVLVYLWALQGVRGFYLFRCLLIILFLAKLKIHKYIGWSGVPFCLSVCLCLSMTYRSQFDTDLHEK